MKKPFMKYTVCVPLHGNRLTFYDFKSTIKYCEELAFQGVEFTLEAEFAIDDAE